jgi:hypothetical protein
MKAGERQRLPRDLYDWLADESVASDRRRAAKKQRVCGNIDPDIAGPATADHHLPYHRTSRKRRFG